VKPGGRGQVGGLRASLGGGGWDRSIPLKRTWKGTNAKGIGKVKGKDFGDEGGNCW
jgi:hypothetical protein